MEKNYLLRKIARIMVLLPVFCSIHGSTCILKNDLKTQNLDGDMDSAIAFVASRSVETI